MDNPENNQRQNIPNGDGPQQAQQQAQPQQPNQPQPAQQAPNGQAANNFTSWVARLAHASGEISR